VRSDTTMVACWSWASLPQLEDSTELVTVAVLHVSMAVVSLISVCSVMSVCSLVSVCSVMSVCSLASVVCSLVSVVCSLMSVVCSLIAKSSKEGASWSL
jgi:hypothetical protein